MSEKILIVDDEKDIADLLEVYLNNDGFTVYKFYTGTDALQCIEQTQLDLAILDVMLPDMDGLSLSAKFGKSISTPSICLQPKSRMRRALPSVQMIISQKRMPSEI